MKVRRHAGLLVVVLLASLVFGAGLASAAITCTAGKALTESPNSSRLQRTTWKLILG